MPKRVKEEPDAEGLFPASTAHQTKLVAIDPGDTYTGVAFFAQDDEDGWYCQDAQEFDPEEFEDAFAGMLFDRDGTPPPIVVYEKWRLYADHAKEKTGSEFPTSQHIGVIKYIVRCNNAHYQRHELADRNGGLLACERPGQMCNDPARRPQKVTIFKQPADIKKPTAGILRHKKIKSVAKPIAREHYHGRDHVVDAELHGWKYVLDELEDKPSKEYAL